MNKTLQAVITAGLFGLLAVGCATPPPDMAGATRVKGGKYLFTATGTALVEAPGETRDVMRATAAAEALARVNLMKTIKGVYITEKVTVEDLILTEQAASMEAAGWLARAIVTVANNPRDFDKETVEATASLLLSRQDLRYMKKYVE